MPIRHDFLTPKREYLERRIYEYAKAENLPVAIDDWNRPSDKDVSELFLRSGAKELMRVIPHTGPNGLIDKTNSDLDDLAKEIVSELTL